MPAKTDHDARRRDVSQAVWRVLSVRGFGGLTLRAVAAEMGATTGLLTHYFSSKRALVEFALEVAEEQTREHTTATSHLSGLAALRTALAGVLPVTPALTEINRVWVGSWDGALSDPELAAVQRARYRRWRARLRPLVVGAQASGELRSGDPDDLVATLAAFAHGLVVHALLDPRSYPHRRQLALLDGQLDALSSP